MFKGASGLLLFLLVLAIAGCSLPNASTDSTVTISGAPIVQIASPLPNATYLSEVAVNIQALISNAGADIDRVEIVVDGVVIATMPSPNPSGAPTFNVTQTWPASGAGTHTIAVSAFRAEGTVSEPQSVTITVVDELPTMATATLQPTSTNTPAPQLTKASTTESSVMASTEQSGGSDGSTQAAPTNTREAAQPTDTQAPTATATSEGAFVVTRPLGLNVRRGASANFAPPLGVLAGEQRVPILAKNPNGQNPDGLWLKIPFGSGEGWVFSGLVDVEGNIDAVPVESGPPIPPPPTVTSAPIVPPTATPGGNAPPPASSGVNLVITGFELRLNSGGDVNNLFINEAATAFVRVVNTGNANANGFFVVLTIVNKSDGGNQLVEAAAVSSLNAGQETLVQIPFTDRAGAGLVKVAVARADNNNQVPESNENDNASSPIEYTLGAR